METKKNEYLDKVLSILRIHIEKYMRVYPFKLCSTLTSQRLAACSRLFSSRDRDRNTRQWASHTSVEDNRDIGQKLGIQGDASHSESMDIVVRAAGGSRGDDRWSKGHDKVGGGLVWRDCGSGRRWHSAVEEDAGSPANSGY